MSNSQYHAVGATESLDAGSEEAMDVEDSETKTPVAGMPDACWVKLGPHHGPEAAGDNALAVPATQSVIDESGVLASKTGPKEKGHAAHSSCGHIGSGDARVEKQCSIATQPLCLSLATCFAG